MAHVRVRVRDRNWNWDGNLRWPPPAFPPRCPHAVPAAAEGAHAGHLPAGLQAGVDVLGGVVQMPAVASLNEHQRQAERRSLRRGD